MKLIHVLSFVSFFFLTTACKKNLSKTALDSDYNVEVEGKVDVIGMTSWQYGTHTLTTTNTLYALSSKTVDLKDYEGKAVKVIAKEIEGYPVDGGPTLLEVISVKD